MAVKHQVLFFGFVAIVLASYVGYRTMSGTEFEKHPPLLRLPPISFYDKYQTRTLDDFRGKVVLVNIWASWCEPCIAEMPSLDRLQGMISPEKLSVVAISIDTTSIEKIAAFLKKHHVKNLQPYWDKDGEVSLKWKYVGLPISVLLDRNGNIVKQYNGPFDWDKGKVLAEIQKQVQKE